MVKMFWEKVAKILHSGAFQIYEIQNFNQTMVMIFQECVGCTAMYWEFNDSCTAKYTFICVYWNFLWKQSGLNHIVHKCFVDRDENVLLICISENIKCSSLFYVYCLIPYLKRILTLSRQIGSPQSTNFTSNSSTPPMRDWSRHAPRL